MATFQRINRITEKPTFAVRNNEKIVVENTSGDMLGLCHNWRLPVSLY
jgi:hypothetical protein